MANRLIERLERHLQRPPSGKADVPELLSLAREAADRQSTPEHPRYSCHILFLAIARTRSHASYLLTAT